jgi:hypothetical protein
MRVVLKHAGIGLYYAGRKHWVGDAGSALDLETIERATELSCDEPFGEMDVVVTYDDSGCERVLPLRRNREAHAAVQAPAINGHPGFREGKLPSEDVRVNGVHQRSIQVED